MKNFWELEPNKVQVEIKNQSHLNELIKMCNSFGLIIIVGTHKHLYKYFRKNEVGNWFSNFEFHEDFTEVSTEQFYEILCHNYGYQGELKGFDKDVVLRILECQEEQKNKRDIKVFEYSCCIGFDWSNTKDGHEFWSETIIYNKGKFPKKQPIPADSQELEKETQSKEIERLNAENEFYLDLITSLKLGNDKLENKLHNLWNINQEMSNDITNIKNLFKKLKQKNKKIKKLV